MTTPPVAPRSPKSVLLSNPYCEPLRQMYDALVQTEATSWNQAEAGFLEAMSRFDGRDAPVRRIRTSASRNWPSNRST